MNQLIDMIVRTVIRRAVNSGVNAGFDAVSKLGQRSGPGPTDMDEAKSQPDPEREKLRAMRQARRAARSSQG
ncbi:hypothetical protein [Ruegeria aquimaris]|nr:hypothetical protein [Ruegeria sp. XHP0148]